MIWFVAGINGAGKSTVAKNTLLLTLMGVRSVINPDLIAREIAQTRGIDYALANLSAAIMTQSMVFNEAVLSDVPVIAMETVLSTTKYTPILDIASQRGFEVGLIYVSVRNVELTLKRIETRTAAGLHNVSEATVRRRWAKTLENCAAWAPRVDRLIVLANNNSEGRVVPVARKVSKASPVEIMDREELPELTELLSNTGRS
jgi:predicted ABC-type ATPase